MKCELLAEQNLALMLDFIDDENTKYDEAVLKAFLEEKNAYGYIAVDNRKAVGFAYGYVLNEPDGQKVYYLHAIDVMKRWQNQGYGTELVRFVHEHSKPWAAAKCFCLPISTMLPPAGVTRKQEESVMPPPMISCLRLNDVLTIPVCGGN